MALFRTFLSGLTRTCGVVPSLTSVPGGIVSGVRSIGPKLLLPSVSGSIQNNARPLSTWLSTNASQMLNPAPVLVQPNRTRILYNMREGKPESVQDVVDRFFRLHNGLWIRGRAGRHKKRWLKSPRLVHQLKQHVFCNRTQCRKLDQMVNREYKTPKYFVDDPYAAYHRKSNLPDYRYAPPKFYP